MRQFGEAVKGGSEEDKQRVIEAVRQYNSRLPPEARAKAISAKELKASVQQRLRVQGLQEQGLPAAKSDVPIARGLEPYYPRGWPQGQTGAQVVK